LIIKAKRNYLKEAIDSKKNSKQIWQFFNTIQGKNNDCPYPLHIEHQNSKYSNLNEIAEIMNTFFTNITDDIKPAYKPLSDINCSKITKWIHGKIPENEYFSVGYINCYETYKMLASLDSNKATGDDDIGPKVLKLSADYLCSPITYIINLCISGNYFPDKMKIAKIIPIHKKDSKTSPTNYRPISILPTISKLFEKHLNSQIRVYLSKNKLFYKNQSGFRENHSCATALIRMTDNWLKAMDDGEMTGVIFLDFSKAFDLIDHRLLHKKTRNVPI